MATRKQRRRREKTFRHEYNLVEIDEEGNETPVERVARERAEKKDAKPARGVKRPEKPKIPKGFTKAFDGKDLNGWRGRQPNYNPAEEAKLAKDALAGAEDHASMTAERVIELANLGLLGLGERGEHFSRLLHSVAPEEIAIEDETARSFSFGVNETDFLRTTDEVSRINPPQFVGVAHVF